jgi:protocatechuate 3,4-dioxygenase beta subunit
MMTLQRLLTLIAVLMLTACGGGGGSGGSSGFTGGTGGTGGTVTPAAANLVLTLSANNIANDGSQTVTATALAVDANNNTVSGVPVTIAVDSGVATPSALVTNASGAVTATLGIGSNNSNRTIKVTAASGSILQTASLQVVALSASAGVPKITVQLSGSTITPAAPATLTVTVLDSAGSPVANGVVALSTLRGNLAKLSATSVLTNNQGVATATLSSAASGVQGADEVVAAITVNAVQIQNSAGFSVTAQAPTIGFVSQPVAPLTLSTAPLTLSAVVRDASGAVVANQLVGFTASNGLVKLSVGTALTNSSGTASVQISPLAASTSGAEIITASASVGSQTVQALASVQINAQAPTLTATVSSSAINATNPATLTVVAKDLTGALLPNTVVTFNSQAGLATFTPVTQRTDASGMASTVISPKTATSAGADTITASITVQGIIASAPTVVQFASNTPSGTPTLGLALSTTSVSAATPSTVTATLLDAQGKGVASQVVTFKVVRGLATTNIATALTNASGLAVVVMSPTNASSAGADEITGSVSYAGVALQQTQGFQVQATSVTLGTLTAAANPLSAYGQTTLTLPVSGASVTSPVNITFASSCVALGKATLSPASVTATSTPIVIQFRDNGCGALQASDQIQAVVTSTGATAALKLDIQSPATASIAFVQATPEQIYLSGSGFAESSLITFQVNDLAGNPLPNKTVELRLQTGAGGVTMEGHGVESVNPVDPSKLPFTAVSNALGQVSVRINSGSVPTPVRVNARLADNTNIATVSSNLSVAVGLPSQINFSLSQGKKNIEGYSIDGTANTYQIFAADRSGNPIPSGTSINFVTEGGQIEAIKQTALVSGIARTVANLVSSDPRPVDGRITVTAYALGEESFIDLNGNNKYDGPGSADPLVPAAGEPFQDLGNVFKDRNFDGVYDPTLDEFIPLAINNNKICVPPPSLMVLDAGTPTVPGTCDGIWSGAGQVYVRRAVETVFSTSAARPLWASTGGLDATCSKVKLQVGPATTQLQQFTLAASDTWYGGNSGTLNFFAADANPGRQKVPSLWADPSTFNPLTDYDLYPRLNPLAAGTVVTASTPTNGLTVSVGGGSPVPSTTEATTAAIAYAFTPPASSGIVFVTFNSPSGVGTTVAVNVTVGTRPTACP